eukprot:5905130-Amphidinium_carterae.2
MCKEKEREREGDRAQLVIFTVAIASFSLATPVYLMAGLRPTSSHFLVFFCDLGLRCIATATEDKKN